MGAWFFLAAAITLAAPQESSQPAASTTTIPADAVAPVPADGGIERFL